MAELSDLSDADFERLLTRLWPLIASAITETVERAANRQTVTAHAANITSVDGAVAEVLTPDNPSTAIPVTRATGAGAGDRCVVLFLPGGRAFALGSIPATPNDPNPGVG